MGLNTWLSPNVDEELYMKEFIFGGVDQSKNLSFIAFQSEKGFLDELLGGSIVILPLTAQDSVKDIYYKKFVNSLFKINNDATWVPYIMYNLENNSWNDVKSMLDLYQSGVFQKQIYYNINLLDKSIKKEALNNLKFKLQHNNIFVNGDTFSIVNQKVLSIIFDLNISLDKYPYVGENSMSLSDIQLKKLVLNIESDYNKWQEQFEIVNKNNGLRGLYSTQILNSDVIINNLNENFQKYNKFCLTGWTKNAFNSTVWIYWTAGRMHERDIKNGQFESKYGILYYGQVFKQSDLILEDKWPWLRDEI